MKHTDVLALAGWHGTWENGDVLVINDDLTTHARTYRELSLLLRRPPEREAYPGDSFSFHSGLLERSTRLTATHGAGMTALPAVESEHGEITEEIEIIMLSNDALQSHARSADASPDMRGAPIGDKP